MWSGSLLYLWKAHVFLCWCFSSTLSHPLSTPKRHEQSHVRACSAMSKTSTSHHSSLAETFLHSFWGRLVLPWLHTLKWWWSKSKGKKLAFAELTWWEFQCRKIIQAPKHLSFQTSYIISITMRNALFLRFVWHHSLCWNAFNGSRLLRWYALGSLSFDIWVLPILPPSYHL